MVCMGDAFSVPFILSCFLSVPSLVAWLIFIVNILGIITDQFCWSDSSSASSSKFTAMGIDSGLLLEVGGGRLFEGGD